MLTIVGSILRLFLLILFLAGKIDLGFESAIFFLFLLHLLSQMFFPFNSFLIHGTLNDRFVRRNSSWYGINLWFEGVIFICFLLYYLFFYLHLYSVLVVKSINLIIWCLLASRWVSLADHFTQYIYLWLELMNCLLRVLISQSFSFLTLSHDKFCLSSLEVFIIALVEVILLRDELARITDGGMECIGVRGWGGLVLHRSYAHLWLHISLDSRRCIVI